MEHFFRETKLAFGPFFSPPFRFSIPLDAVPGSVTMVRLKVRARFFELTIYFLRELQVAHPFGVFKKNRFWNHCRKSSAQKWAPLRPASVRPSAGGRAGGALDLKQEKTKGKHFKKQIKNQKKF